MNLNGNVNWKRLAGRRERSPCPRFLQPGLNGACRWLQLLPRSAVKIHSSEYVPAAPEHAEPKQQNTMHMDAQFNGSTRRDRHQRNTGSAPDEFILFSSGHSKMH